MNNKSIKELTKSLIDSLYYTHYKRYLRESQRYGWIINTSSLTIIIFGFLTTLFLGLREMLTLSPGCQKTMYILAFILPSVSSVILIFVNQNDYRRKEELRENARVYVNHLINEAKARFSGAKDDKDYLDIYQWLNEEINKI